jgi:hypothetical protein
MTRVRIIKSWPFPDIFRQTPGGSRIWDGIEFTTDPIEEADYVIVFTTCENIVRVTCPPAHVWAVMLEPPDEDHIHFHKGDSSFYRVYTHDESIKGKRYVVDHTPLPWWVNKTYDQLKGDPPPEKTRCLSWITSTKAQTRGHRSRVAFLEKVQKEIPCDLFGKGLTPIEDKWDGLAPYRYSLAVENFSNPYYWTEKIADCYLSWTMPIYYGCTRIEDYFPAESMVRIDINDPDSLRIIHEVTASDRRERNLEAIAEARRRILERYQIFPYLADRIRKYEQQEQTAGKPKVVEIGADPLFIPWHNRLRGMLSRRVRSVIRG